MIRRFHSLLEKRAFAYGTLALLHIGLICAFFPRYITHPSDTFFTSWGDGIKNYFNLISYVKEPVAPEGLLKYNTFGYPFGDYVYATDNTPFFAIPFKWFCLHVWDISDHVVACFNFFILSNILLCGLTAFYVFRRLWNHTLLAWLLAIFLPWTNFQLGRVFASHFNLSFTSFTLIAIILFLWWRAAAGNLTKQLLLVLLMSVFGYCCFLVHGYYIAIITPFICGMLFFSGLAAVRKRQGQRSLAASVLVLLLTGAAALFTMKATDGYFGLRQEFARGYDWMEQKTNFSLMFTHYSFHRVYFPIWIEKNADDIELMAYLGNIGLFAMAGLFIVSLFSRRFRLLLWDIQKACFRDPLMLGIFFSGLMLLSMSFGENYYPLMQRLRITLPFNRHAGFSIPEMLLAAVMLLLLAYWGIRMLRGAKGKPVHALPQESRAARIARVAGFYILSAILLYLMFGHYHIDYFVNRSNPLYLMHQFTRVVEQFRSMVRFAWPFYWTFYIWLFYTVAAVYRQVNRPAQHFIIGSILLLGCMETLDYGAFIRKRTDNPSLLSKEQLRPLQQLKISFGAYQAIMPIPYYNAGSEDYDLTFDDIGEWSNFSYQLSLFSRLPLMSSKMSRTPPAFARDLMLLISEDSCSAALKERLSDKPILLAVHRKFISDSTIVTIPNKEAHPGTYAAYWRANQLAQRNKLQPVDSLGDIYFYNWKPCR